MIVSMNVSHFVRICQVLTILHQLICRGVANFGTRCTYFLCKECKMASLAQYHMSHCQLWLLLCYNWCIQDCKKNGGLGNLGPFPLDSRGGPLWVVSQWSLSFRKEVSRCMFSRCWRRVLLILQDFVNFIHKWEGNCPVCHLLNLPLLLNC